MINPEYIDALTKIYNRAGLYSEFNTLKAPIIQVAFFDIDNFKTVNDMYGHHCGDEVLKRFASILSDSFQSNSLVVRLGGDEFVVIIPSDITRDQLDSMLDSVLNKIRNLKKEDRIYEVVSASIGVLSNYNTSDGLDSALNRADKAMYYAKESGKNAYVYYCDYEAQIRREKEIETNAVRDLDSGRFVIHYHPILHLHTSELLRSEACCMWLQEDGTYIGRNDFRPVLEKNGFIREIDLHIFRLACNDVARFKKAGRKNDIVSVQLSYLHILDETLLNRLEEIMDEHGVKASDFEINMDEKAFGERIDHQKLITNLKKLSQAGFSLALSKFGEDFSSMKFLRQLPITTVKFDGDFILNNLPNHEGIRVLKSAAEIGKGFKFLVTACRVQDINSLTTLAKCGFDAASGDYFCTKRTFDDYLYYLNTQLNNQGQAYIYHFINTLADENSQNEGVVIGEGIEFTAGVSPKWGALKFPGGPVETNYIKLPSELFEYDSYSVSMWLKPYELQNWSSAFYVRYQDGFMSFMPNVPGGRAIYRINEDEYFDKWHDALTGGLSINKWAFVAFVYDAYTQISRLYINGELALAISDVPSLKLPQEVWLGGDNFQVSYKGLVSALQINKGAISGETVLERYQSFISEMSENDSSLYSTDIIIHDPAIYEDTVNHKFYIYSTDAQGFESLDLVHWKALGKIVEAVPDEAKSWTSSDSIWAPDIVKVNDEYRLYCSNSSWGVQQSCIFLATSSSPAGPFIPKAPVLKTDSSMGVNGIDANIVDDVRSGRQYMVYGSFWGGVHIIELNKESGLAIKGQGIGKKLAARPLWNDGAIEGPYIIYHKDTDYYYLFVSYGSLKSDYNIRVGRSRSITGPYLDYNGVDLADTSDNSCSTGLMIACGYRWVTGQAYMGPGHNSVLLRDNGDMYLVCHIRKLSFNSDPGPGLLQIRKMIMTPDGWPIALSQPYIAVDQGQNITSDECLLGSYERIELRPSIPQGIQHAHPMTFLDNGRLEIASVIGSWKHTSDNTIELKYGPITEYIYFELGYDKEMKKNTILLSGLTTQGICTWAKKVSP